MVANLSKNLTQKAIRFAGNGTKHVFLEALGDVIYDIETGSYEPNRTTIDLGNGILGPITERERVKYDLTDTTHKITVSTIPFSQETFNRLPQTEDKLLIENNQWNIENVRIGSMHHSFTFFICEA